MQSFVANSIKLAFAAAIVATGFSTADAARRDGEWYRDLTSGAMVQHRTVRRNGYRSNKSPIRKRNVRFDSKYAPGTIVVDTSERRLYFVTKRGRALKYGIGVGRDGFTWTGTHNITRKATWPSWTPPKVMIARVKRETGVQLKSFYPGGPDNPMGAAALYIGSTIYRIHGTNQPWTIGQAMSSGCIRMANDDIQDLHARARVGSRIIVRH